MHAAGKSSDMASQEGDYTNPMYFYLYLVAKYMRLPNFWKTPKNV